MMLLPLVLLAELMDRPVSNIPNNGAASGRSNATNINNITGKIIGIIGGADGPTSIYVASKLAPDLLGAIAVASYSYMALVPLIQPPIMRALTTQKERQIKMVQLREVSTAEKINTQRFRL
jgi:Na+-transporting methylmalonyl-CoA/oxaloacetate decarboxylase beta subunit